MNIYGICYGNHRIVRYFRADIPLELGQFVIVPLPEALPGQGQGGGQALGRVLRQHVASAELLEDMSSVVRAATPSDFVQEQENRHLAASARKFCAECIMARQLDMKLVDVEVYHDRSKLVFYFTAPTRIDFRELVKDLVREYRSRIELRQIGVRHETQMIGAMGNCGMVCCCRRFLRKFAPVTIRMAKEQNLFLNPAKISGMCGRLLCCLSYEQENYEAFHRACPRIGKKYHTSRGDMKVLRSNMFRNSVAVLNENNIETELGLETWQALEPRRPELPRSPQPSAGQVSTGPPSARRHTAGESPAVSAEPDAEVAVGEGGCIPACPPARREHQGTRDGGHPDRPCPKS